MPYSINYPRPSTGEITSGGQIWKNFTASLAGEGEFAIGPTPIFQQAIRVGFIPFAECRKVYLELYRCGFVGLRRAYLSSNRFE